MPAFGVAALGVAGGYLALTAVRAALAGAVLRRAEPGAGVQDGPAGSHRPEPGAGVQDGRVTVLQAILSGDPAMPGNLAENLANHPDTHFVWLVDDSDAEGRRVAASLADRQPRVEVVLTPPPPAGANPKVFKLVIGVLSAGDLVAVLDDDTVLPAGALDRAVAALSTGDLVTGVPVYRTGTGLWSRLVAAFVNGNALLTYLPVLAFAPPVTINGMFYLTRRDTLAALGGFEAILGRLCDDYELAKLYRRGGKRIVQTTIFHPLSTTVPGPGAYLRLLRRWLVFANQLLREALTVPVFCLVVLPSALPLTALVLAVAGAGTGAGPLPLAAVVGALLAKAVGMAALRRRVAGTAESPATVLTEVLADLLLPVHAATTAVRPDRIRWRDKDIRFGPGGSLG